MNRTLALIAGGVLAAVFTSGCATTQPQARVGEPSEPQYVEKIEMTVGADQSMVMDGRKFQVADSPRQLVKANTSKHLIIVVYPESKLLRETLVTLLDLLKKEGYYFTAGEGTKFADVLLAAQG